MRHIGDTQGPHAYTWKHPKTGTYWIRLRVPDRLQDKLRKQLFQRTLGTKNVAEAKVWFADALAELNERWARLSAEPGRLTHRQRKALAGEYRRWSIARREEDPGKPADLRREIDHARFCVSPPGRRVPSPGIVVRELLDTFLEERGIAVHPMGMSNLRTTARTRRSARRRRCCGTRRATTASLPGWKRSRSTWLRSRRSSSAT